MADSVPTGFTDRLPPQSLEAEMAVLGAMLLQPDTAQIRAEVVE